MEQNIYPIITINREYGARGRTYAKALAEALNLPWYDRDLIRKAAEESGFSEQEIQEEGEELSSKEIWLDKIMNSAVIYSSSHDRIFQSQKEVILKLAESPCIIVGRCANVILREAGVKTFDIFLFADMEKRLEVAAELGENGKYDLRKYVERMDHFRENFYKHYTKKEFGYYKDYDVLLNTGLGTLESDIKYLSELIGQK